jgi:tetratricopeptide (TPR) repeat protein
MTLVALAQAHLALHEFEPARDAALVAIESPDAAAAGLGVLVDVEMALGEYGAARSRLSQLHEVIGGEPAYLGRRAHLAFLTGDIDTAVRVADRAVSVSRESGQTVSDQVFYRALAGRLHFESGSYATAEDHLREALALDDRNPGALFELGRTRAARGDLDGAVELLERSVALVPEPTSLALLGDLYQALGSPGQSDAQYATIGAVSSLGAYRLPVAMAYAGRGIEPAAAVDLATMELQYRTDPVAWHVYGLALLRVGKPAEAYEALSKALGPADARLLYHAGLAALAAGDSEQAVAHLQAAIDLNPSFHPLDADEAIRLLEELDS